jgi:hypothetical protein
MVAGTYVLEVKLNGRVWAQNIQDGTGFNPQNSPHPQKKDLGKILVLPSRIWLAIYK